LVDLTKLDQPTIARHLSKPEGEIGCALADRNWPVYQAAFRRLGTRPGERFFEAGFGNGKLVPRLLGLAPKLTYTGVDFSETMVGEAEVFNKGLIDAGPPLFGWPRWRRSQSTTARSTAR
jgi:hypothetical protein